MLPKLRLMMDLCYVKNGRKSYDCLQIVVIKRGKLHSSGAFRVIRSRAKHSEFFFSTAVNLYYIGCCIDCSTVFIRYHNFFLTREIYNRQEISEFLTVYSPTLQQLN